MGWSWVVSLCQQAPLPMCVLLGPKSSVTEMRGVQPSCVSRALVVANTMIFQGAASFAHIVALVMTVTMILHVRSKFTAVGRKEILSFFYLYMLFTAVSLILDAGVVPLGNASYPYFCAVQNGLAVGLCVCLLINGFVGFQLYEDGTRLSMAILWAGTGLMFALGFLISVLTFDSVGGLDPQNTIGLFIVVYVFSALALIVYVVMQTLLVVRTLNERWPLGDIGFGVFFFVVGQVLLYGLSPNICDGAAHYLDGLLFATICNLLAIMMVYKFWDSITREDTEFSVSLRTPNWDGQAWDSKEPMERTATFCQDAQSESASLFQPPVARRDSHG